MAGEEPSMTTGMKAMMVVVFVSVLGLFTGLAGLVADWQAARQIGAVSLCVLIAVFALVSELKTGTVERILFGKKTRSKD